MGRPIFLIGFMAAGKSTVGPLVAASLGRRFFDLDTELAARHQVVVADLAARDEAGFRALERRTLQALISEARAAADGRVIATGGGAPCFADNAALMREAGLVVALTADFATAMARARASGQARPLLGDEAEARALAARRARFYRTAHAQVATDELVPEAVAARVVAVARQAEPFAELATVAFVATQTPYPVVVAASAWEAVATALPGQTQPSGYHCVADAKVADLYQGELRALAKALPHGGADAPCLEIPSGEASKNVTAYGALTEALLAASVDRHAHIVAIGGGATSDAVGFAAATLMRGVAWSVMPTTLLAMVDAAIGGKTALDTPAGKNTLGAFWQPLGVWAGLDTLATLPARERQSAFGELIKYALLDGQELWDEVAAHAAWARAGGPPPPTLRSVIYRAARYKCHVVSVDERETKQARILLNLGHTMGHAIEHATKHLAHGEAVGLGLLAASHISTALGLAPAQLGARIASLLAACGLAHELAPYVSDEVMAYISSDKKRRGDHINYVAIRDVGDCVAIRLPVTEVVRILRTVAN